ncbi:hypothetical protein Pan241w_11500 [Gimesia alba]|uniref:Uncharacterized protein n=1 Tax=Gimesia alba TaxID=2527973 RepID=A0A517RB38_9PLAN|nr:hypothetical protein [Gimesia alba]QDT41091.1 hypothetical protein Pan241w_11500 [Gimesia alba]
MLVETYETPEVDEQGTVECEAEALELIESLDLEGQRELTRQTEDGEVKRVPYPKVTKEQGVVIQAVCPKETKLNEYSDQAIPLRILQVAAHAKDLFDYLVVWHPENADEKDPYLIGCNGESWSSSRELYLLARWGEELLPWGEMVTKAGALIRGKRLTKLREIVSLAKAAIEATESADPEAAIELSATPSYYDH